MIQSAPKQPVFNCLLYEQPPQENVTRKVVQSASMLRLHLYKVIQAKNINLDLAGPAGTLSGIEIRKDFGELSAVDQDLIHDYFKSSKPCKEDAFSHFMCRAIFCESEQKIHKFVSFEEELFAYRLEKHYAGQLSQILQALERLIYKTNLICPIPPEEMAQYRNEILASASLKSQKEFFKVPFYMGSQLLSKWECFAHRGFLYAGKYLMARVAKRLFSVYLRKKMHGLFLIRKELLESDEDNQYRQFVKFAYDKVFQPEATPNDYKDPLSFKNIAIKSQQFPPCMKNMYLHLEKDRHLKNHARMQYLLFLKEAGMPIKETEAYWAKYLTRGANDAKMKEYLYGVKHAYGQVGTRKDYDGHKCESIINSKPGKDEHHGCPFKEFGKDPLRDFLGARYHLQPADIQAILEIRDQKQYQRACKTLFRKTHPDPQKKFEESINKVGLKPAMYFYQSCQHEQYIRDPVKYSMKVYKKSGTTPIKQEAPPQTAPTPTPN